MSRRSAVKRAVAAVGAVLMVAGCANVPLETKPQAIAEDSAAAQNADVGNVLPEKDLSASDVVRDFVETNALTANNYDASRQYLDGPEAKSWRPSETMTLLDEDFGTVLVSQDEQPDQPDMVKVRLTGRKVGSLYADNSFGPVAAGSEAFHEVFTLRRQADTKQWRIVGLPAEVMTTKRLFLEHFRRVVLYYFAPGSDVQVPDPRYLPQDPSEGLPARVIDAVLKGPSASLRGAVDHPMHNAAVDVNVRRDEAGALQVPLTRIAEESPDTKRRIVTQVLFSLENVFTGRVRLLSDGKPLLEARKEWRIGDLEATTPVVSDSAGIVLSDRRLHSLATKRQVAGPAGQGEYDVLSAAQSLEGGQLALVERQGKAMALRIGLIGKAASAVNVRGSRLTRPTWQPAYPGNELSYEVWTVVNGSKVVRAKLTQEETWSPQRVDASELAGFGKITALRLSRDGTRAAIVANRKLVVASVGRSKDSVRLRAPRILQPDRLTEVVDVDWLGQDSLAVATESSSQPVVKVDVDGFDMQAYSPANLDTTVNAISATDDGKVLVSNDSGVWMATHTDEVWTQQPPPGASSPFFPG